MPLNPQTQAVLDMLAEVTMSPESLGVQGMRDMANLAEVAEPVGLNKVENRTLSFNGVDVPVRIYTPVGEGPHPLMVYYHGGGWVICGLDSHDGTCQTLCREASAVVVSVDYRLAPEHKYPAAADDSYAATLWAYENASELNARADQLIVSGDSAGANLATVVALMARDKAAAGEAVPRVAYQALIYPVTDYDFSRESYRANASGFYLETDTMKWFWEQYADGAPKALEPYASPIRANLGGLPPGLVITAEYDPLHDEGEAYAAKLNEAGVATEYIRYEGQIHGFVGMKDAIDDGQHALETIAAKVREFFSY